jgi:predicted aspartyl protease
MDEEPVYVNFGINGVFYTKAMIDTGCLSYGTISKALVRRLRLPRIPITPRDLEQVKTVIKKAITHVTYLAMDIDGHKQKRVFFYIIPNQAEDVILGKLWMRAQQVEIAPARNEIRIGSSGLVVKERSWDEGVNFPVQQHMASIFMGLVRQARKSRASDRTGGLQVFAASFADIEKALAPKKHSDPREKLPK